MAKGVISLQKESGGIVKISPVDGIGVTELVVPESGNLVSVDTAVTDNAIARYDGTTGKLQNSGVTINDKNWLNIGGYCDAYLDILASNNSTSEKIFRAGILGVTNGFSISKDSVANINYAFNTTNGSNGVEIDGSGNVLIKAGTGALGYGTGAGGTVTQYASKNTAVILNKPTGQITMNSAVLAAGVSVSFTFTNSLIANTDILVLSLKNGSGSVNAYKFFSECANGNGVIQVTNISGINLAEAIVINFAIIKGATT